MMYDLRTFLSPPSTTAWQAAFLQPAPAPQGDACGLPVSFSPPPYYGVMSFLSG